MSTTAALETLPQAADRWPVRIWPAVAILVAAAAIMAIPAILISRTMAHFISLSSGPAIAMLSLSAWWVFGSRVRGPLRWLVPALVLGPAIAFGVALYRGNPLAVILCALPPVLLAWVGWLIVSRSLSASVRQVGVVAAIVFAWVGFALVRVEGFDGDLVPSLSWRWEPTAEERFAAERALQQSEKKELRPLSEAQPGDWPEFRGPARDSRVSGFLIDTEWSVNPPQLVWKKRVGPGWGSFALVGGRLFTQEQRGQSEAVVCYDAISGEEVWEHLEPGRFYEGIAGAGPRATPTVVDDHIYALGATGKLVCLDAATGNATWVKDVAADAKAAVPQWGFASSPLVREGRVIVCGCGGAESKGTLAYNAANGDLAWASGLAKHSYSSPHPAKFGGVEQVLQLSDFGLEAFALANGKPLWQSPWTKRDINRVTQPLLVGETDVVFGTGVGPDQGIRRVSVSKSGDGWQADQVWSTRDLSAYYNDGVAFGPHFYGFDGANLCCLDLATGKQLWKESGYGYGQLVLLADQGVLVVLTDRGEAAVVAAKPEEHEELGRFKAIQGKTWNHPVVAHGMLFVRNGEEAACYQLRVK